MKKIFEYRTIIFIIIFISFFAVFSIVLEYGKHQLDIYDAKALNIGWKDHETNIYFDLPYQFDDDGGETQGFSIVLHEDFKHPQSILIRGSLQDVVVAIGGNIIYEHDLRDAPSILPYASLWHFIDVPEDSDGQMLTVFLHSPYDAMSGHVNEIFYGSRNDLNAHILIHYGDRLVIGLFTLALAILVTVISLFIDKTKKNNIVYLGLFGILLSLWLLGESRTLQLFIDSTYFHGSISYYMLALLPIPIIVYIKRNILNEHQKMFHLVITYFIIQFIVIVLLQMMGWVALFESVVVTQISIFVTLVFTVYLIVRKVLREPENKLVKTFLVYLLIFGAVATLEVTSFILKDFELLSIYVHWIVILIMIVLLTTYVKTLNMNYHIQVENQALEKLAFIDRLTGSQNRHAYEELLDTIFAHQDKKHNLKIVYFDFNDLKQINDVYGHDIGDQVLIDGYQMIEQSFGSIGECFRIGGDEFSCLMIGVNHALFKAKSQIFESLMKAYNEDSLYTLGISYGMAIYDDNLDHKPKDIIKRADQMMYRHKNNHKNAVE